MEKNHVINTPPTVDAILELLNNQDAWDCSLYEILQDINWSEINAKTFIPKYDLRRFTKSIQDKEVRLAVMKFLHEYARYYFYDKAYDLAFDDFTARDYNPSGEACEHETDIYIGNFQSELATQISQIEKSGEFSGDRFSKLKKRIQELEEQVAKLQAENKLLAHTIDVYEHPLRNGWSIPSELIESEFWHIIKYLIRKQMVVKHEERGVMGIPQVACYRWIHPHKGLFGYFADRVSYELDIYKKGHVQWKLFKQAFINYADVEKQAKDTISKYKSWAKPQAPLPTGYEIIDEAIKYAEEQMKKEQEKTKKMIL